MILALPKVTKKQYETAKSNFYKKPGIPDIELELEEYQKELLLKANYGILPAFREKLAVYAKSILLKQVKGSSDYIDPSDVEDLAEVASENFIKRYFRTDEPVVGASFAGILIFKVREVLSTYFKNLGIESNLSLDTLYEDSDSSSNNSLTVEQLLSYKVYENSEDIQERLLETKNLIYEKIETECNLLKQVHVCKKLNIKFLKYLVYIYVLQNERMDKKLTAVSAQAIRLIEDDEEQILQLTPVLESALLDIKTAL